MKVKRVLLKISGEAFAHQDKQGLSFDALDMVAKDVVRAHQEGVQIAIVVGGGNYLRGATAQNAILHRVTADQMGMLATIMNGLALRDAIEACGGTCVLLSAMPVLGVADAFHYRKAVEHLNKKRIVIFAGGTGNPFVTTDSAASLRAIEIGADLLLKATKVDGVYDKDPHQFNDAKKFTTLSYDEALKKELAIMDLSAFCQCRDYHVPIRVFNLFKPSALYQALIGSEEGTLVS